jgi:hypothetical protein
VTQRALSYDPAAMRAVRSALLTVLLLCSSGCLVCWGILNPDGSGMLEITFDPPKGATRESLTADFSSAHVAVDSVTLGTDRRAVVRVHFDDITQLSTAPWFAPVSISRTREANDETVRIVLKHTPGKSPDPQADGPRISLTVPGRIIEANKDAEVTDDRVVWRYTMGEFNSGKERELVVRYHASGVSPTARRAGRG